MIAVTVHGAEGRMGRMVAELIGAARDCRLAALITEPGSAREGMQHSPGLALVGQDKLALTHPKGGVIVDFSRAEALRGLLHQSDSLAAPLVIGTTGHSRQQIARLKERADEVPVVLAPNFSMGIPALLLALRQLARTLPPEFAAEQVETHHGAKVDRPSGTALWLAAGWRQERGGPEVPIHSQRLGGIIGEHRWTLADQEESIELVHRAHSRRAFLRGVLPAVRFAAGAGPGFYGMQEVLESIAASG